MKSQKAQYKSYFDLELFEGALTTHVFPWHFHDCYTIVMVKTGAMKYIFREGYTTVKACEVLVINPLQSHYNFSEEGNCSYRVIFLPAYFINRSQMRFRFPSSPSSSPNLYGLLVEIFQQIRNMTDHDFLNRLANNIALLLFKYFPAQRDSSEIDPRIAQATGYIRSHLDEKLTIEGIANACHLSRYYFQRLFKSNVGITVNEYIQQQRMERGKTMIRQGNSIVKTALETGYFDQSHFHKQFKRMYVAPPGGFIR